MYEKSDPVGEAEKHVHCLAEGKQGGSEKGEKMPRSRAEVGGENEKRESKEQKQEEKSREQESEECFISLLPQATGPGFICRLKE